MWDYRPLAARPSMEGGRGAMNLERMGGVTTFHEVMRRLQGMTSREIRTLVHLTLGPRRAERFDELTANVRHDVLVFASARALLREHRVRVGA